MNWIPTSQKKPEPYKSVLAVYKSYGRHVVRVVWIPKFFKVEECDYEGDADYHEEKDEYYWPEGWYEWSQEAEINYRLVDDKITHWMHLPELPDELPNERPRQSAGSTEEVRERET